MPDIAALRAPPLYQFGAIELRSDGTLSLDGSTLHLPPKELHVLRLLLDRPDVVVSKHALLDAVWPRCDIGEESLTRCVYSLRKMFGPYKQYIATVYGKGYRLTCGVIKHPRKALVRDRFVRVVPRVPLGMTGLLKKSRAHRVSVRKGHCDAASHWRIQYVQARPWLCPLPGSVTSSLAVHSSSVDFRS